MLTIKEENLLSARPRLRIISDQFGQDYQELCRFPSFSKWDKDKGRHLLIEPVYSNLKFLFDIWDEDQIEWEGENIAGLLADYKKHIEEQEEILCAKDAIQVDDPFNYIHKLKPYDHQQRCFLLSRTLEKFAVFAEQGTGKTKIIIDTIAFLHERGEIDAAIIIAPKGVHRNWIDEEIPEHMPDRINYEAVFHRAGNTKKLQGERKEICRPYSGKGRGLKIFSMNVDSFRSDQYKLICHDMIRQFGDQRMLVVIDESDIIKNPGSKQTKEIIKMFSSVKWKRILTGTPITEGVENIFSQFKFLSPNILGYTTYTAFKGRYCITGKWNNVEGYKNLDEISEKIEAFSFRVLKKECLDLPPKVYKIWKVEMTTSQRKLIKELKDDWETELDGEKLTEKMALSRIIRLQQISAGWWPSKDDLDEVELKPLPENPKLKGLLDCLSFHPGKALIWTKFKKDAEIIKEALGADAVTYLGSDGDEARAENKLAFQNDEKIKYMICSIQAASKGLTLTAADFAVIYTNHHGLVHRLQLEDRNHRIDKVRNEGRESIPYIDICVMGTLDRLIVRSLKSKKSISDIVLKDPASMFLEFENEK